jgi:hypothetical protein
MRRILFATAAVLGLAAGGATAETYSMGGTAENSAGHFLQTAQDLLARHENMAARVALEQAETRLLDRSVTPAMARQPDTNPQVQQIAEARAAIDRGDSARARELISQAIGTASGTGGTGYGGTPMGADQNPSLGSGGSGQAGPANEGAAMGSQPGMRR